MEAIKLDTGSGFLAATQNELDQLPKVRKKPKVTWFGFEMLESSAMCNCFVYDNFPLAIFALSLVSG